MNRFPRPPLTALGASSTSSGRDPDRLGSGVISLPKQSEIGLKSPEFIPVAQPMFGFVEPHAGSTWALALQNVVGSNPFSRF